MNRIASRILWGAICGGLVGTLGFAVVTDLRYPNYMRDSGMPSWAVGIILFGPIGAVAGAILFALWPGSKKD